jgi:hypothetical protein
VCCSQIVRFDRKGDAHVDEHSRTRPDYAMLKGAETVRARSAENAPAPRIWVRST